MRWTMGADPLMDMIVTEVPEAWREAARAPRVRTKPTIPLGLLNNANPFEVGAARATPSAPLHRPRANTEGDALPQADGPPAAVATADDNGNGDLDENMEAEMRSEVDDGVDGATDSGGDVNGVRDEVIEYICDIMDEAASGVSENDGDPEPDEPVPHPVPEEYESESDADREALKVATTIKLPELPERVAAATVSEAGYVSLKIEPWLSLARTCGRVQSFPTTKPLAQRRVVIVCYMHPKCETKPVPRWSVTDEFCLRCFFCGAVPNDDGSHRTAETATEHMAQWDVLRRESTTATSTSASSSGPAPTP